MKTATLLLLISALLGVELQAATVSFSNIPATNVVKATDLLLLDSALGGTNYSTRTLTVSNLANVVAAPVGTVVASGTNAAGMVLTAVDDKETNGVWSDPIWQSNGTVVGLSDTSQSTKIVINRSDYTNSATLALVDISLNNPANTAAQTETLRLYNGNASIGPGDAMDFGTAQYALTASWAGINGDGDAVGIFSSSEGLGDKNYGIVSLALNSTNNVAIAASAANSGNTGVGGYFETSSIDYGNANPSFSRSVLLLDNRDSGNPIITGRTNNGTTVFQVTPDGAIAAGSTNQWRTGEAATNLTITASITNAVVATINGRKVYLLIANETPP